MFRFVDSLTAKTFTEPPTIDAISDLFQEFYIKAGSHISTHISTLQSRMNREASANAKSVAIVTMAKQAGLKSNPSRESLKSLDKQSSDQQMLTASEVTQRRKARRLLEVKRIALEEAVERRACEKIYHRIWRHKSTLDEVRDEKLRSKQAALALVGIGLKDLGIEIGDRAEKGEETVREWLTDARESLMEMNIERCPLGKLKCLEAAHKSIVETLSKFHASSSSADEILPTLIFTLITCPPEGINAISNLYFIERFRAATKIDGEAAYCMTNFEAAISFLETVDLSSLRADETPQGPSKSSSRPNTPGISKIEPFPNLPPSMPSLSSDAVASTSESNAIGTSLQPPSTGESAMANAQGRRSSRRSSNPFQLPSKVIGAANDAVRNTAEEVSKNISNSLDNSFKFLFGRLKEHNEEKANGEVVVPKTLDEARALVSPILNSEDGTNLSETSSITDLPGESPDLKMKSDDKLLGLIGGRKPSSVRERSADSSQSNGSGRRVAFAAPTSISGLAQSSSPLATSPGPNAFDSVKNLGNALNPMAHFSAFGGGLRSLGSKAAPALAPPAAQEKDKRGSTASTVEIPKHAAETIQFEPPIQKFLDIKDVDQLKMGEISELLRDYQRLSGIFAQLKAKD